MTNTTPTWALIIDGVPHTTGLTKAEAQSLFVKHTARDPHSEVEMYIKEETHVMRYAVSGANEDEVNVYLEDGGVVGLYINEDGGHVTSVYYHSRPNLFDKYMWHELAEGDSHYKDWEGEKVITEKIVHDALHWLCPMADGFRQVDRELLFDGYNKGRKQELDKSALLNAARILIEARSGRKVELIEFEDGSLLRYNVVFEGMEAKLFFELKQGC